MSEYSEFLRSYLTVGILGLTGAALVFIMLGVGRLLRPVRPTTQKLITYESGVDPVGIRWTQAQIRYYVFALLFLLFDIEAVFIVPWAVQLETLSMFGLLNMAVFVVVLDLGLLYAWRRGALRWV